MRKLSCFVLTAILCVFFSLTVLAQSSIRLSPFLSGLSSPVFMTNAGDGTNRLFVVEKGGVIKVVQPGSTVPTVFLNISSRVSTSGERGLLGLAFHPDYEINRRFFVYFTKASDGDIQIAEYQASATNSNVADTTEKVIITIEHSGADNHNGGTIAFGPDGFLYAGTGDGGGGNDPSNNAQRTNNLLGKFIRIDINNTPTYSIPAGNPFTGANTVLCNSDDPAAGNTCQEIYSYGLRNPYRFSFDRGGGQLWAGDVGQGAREEIDIITLGGNYGWRILEGSICTPGVNPNCTPPANDILPVFEYSSANDSAINPSSRCSVTGGYVYRGTQGTFSTGTYVYSDYCSGEIMTGGNISMNTQPTVLLSTGRNVVSFGEDEAGELYVVGIGGTVEKIAPLATPTPTPTPTATPTATPTPAGFESDVAPRPNGDGLVLSNDVNQTERFFRRLDTAAITPNEFQRADSAPRVTDSNGVVIQCGDGVIDSSDLQQARRYFNQIDPLTAACGPTGPLSALQMMRGETDTDALGKSSNKGAFDELNKPNESVVSTLAVESTLANAGSTISVNVRVTPQGNETQYGFVLNFDPMVLSFTGTNGTGNTGASSASCNLTAVPGEIFCAVTGFTKNLSGTNEMFGEISVMPEQILISPSFELAANTSAGEVTTLRITEASASNELAQGLAVTSADGTVTTRGRKRAPKDKRVKIATVRGQGNILIWMDGTHTNIRSTTNSFNYYNFGYMIAGNPYFIADKDKRYILNNLLRY